MRPLRPLVVLWLTVTATVPAALYLVCTGERQARALAAHALTRATGLPSTIRRLGVTAAPALVLEGVRMTEALRIGRIELRPWASGPAVVLHRPALRPWPAGASCRSLQRHLRQPARQGGHASRGTTSHWRAVEVIDGSVRLACALDDGSPLSVQVDGISLGGVARPARRLVLGPAQVSFGGQLVVKISAAALDLQRDQLLPQRGAFVGGRLALDAQALLAFQVGRLRRNKQGALQLEVSARPVGRARASGRITFSLTQGRPGAPHRLRATLSDADASGLGPLAARLGVVPDDARLGGELNVEGRGDHYRARGKLFAKRLLLLDPAVAPRMVGPFDGQIALSVQADLAAREARIERLTLSSANVALEVKGTVAATDGGARIKLAARAPATPCQTLLSALPRGFVPSLEGMGLAGKVGVDARLDLDSAALEKTTLDLSLEPMTCRVTADPPLADVKRLKGEIVVALRGAGDQREQWRLSGGNPAFRRLGRISRHLRASFVAAEDANFFKHDGFDTHQLHRAFVDNLRSGRMLRGASTISQQLVKNVFLDNRRNLSRKLQEAVLTWRMEQVLSKKRILELYLNLVEMGPGVHGVEQASQRYFGVAASDVTPLQAAHLAAMTPSPRPLAERFARADPGAAWMGKLRQILRLMWRGGYISGHVKRRWSKARLKLVRRPTLPTPSLARNH